MSLSAFGSPVPGALGSWLDAGLASGLLFALPLGLLGIAWLRFGLLPRLGAHLPPRRDRTGRALGVSLAAVFALLLLTLAPPALVGAFRPDAPGYVPFFPAAAPAMPSLAAATFGFFAVQSLTEELLFRAFFLTLLAAVFLLLARLLFGRLPRPEGTLAGPDEPLRARRAARRWLGAGLLANAVQSAVFALLHARNPNVTPLALVNIALAGAVLGWLYWGEGGVLGCWIFHVFWNFTLAALALPVSGLTFGPALLPTRIAGAGLPLLSGGAFGPEGSILNTAGLVALLAVLIRRSARRLPTGYAPP